MIRDKEQTKKQVVALFEQGRVQYVSDIARHLNLDLKDIVELVSELMDEGKITYKEII